VRLAAAPRRSPLEQLRSRGGDDEERNAGRPLDQMVDEIEHVLIRPVQVLENEGRGALVAEGLQKAPPGGKAVLAADGARIGLDSEAHQRSKVRLDPARLRLVADEPRDGFVELPPNLVLVVRL